jgi:hypothetical protein
VDAAAGAARRPAAEAVPVEDLTVDGGNAPRTASSNVVTDPGRGLPRRLRRPLAFARVELRRPTAGLRSLPQFLILGTQRGGTTSLYRYLAEHPDVRRPLRKEIQYFTLHHGRGEGWYRSHFPFSGTTFEATPYYLFHPQAPARAAACVPDAKLLVLLREPAGRAFSHWQHTRGRGLEPLGFEDALDAEAARVDGEAARLASDPSYRSEAHRSWSYATRGQYAEQLERWLAVYPREQLLVVRSEDLYERPAETHARVLEFLGLPVVTLHQYARHTRRAGSGAMPAGVRERLRTHFRPHNERLAALLGPDVRWDD